MTATEKYHAVLEGKMQQAEFVRQMRQAYPEYITQWNGYNDSVTILKQKQLIFEKKESKKDIKAIAENFPIEAVERGIDIELETAGIDSTGYVTKEQYLKAKNQVEANLRKDLNHYLNLMSGESNKVDKHDKMKETKRGAKDADTFNAMKKATLKEGVEVSKSLKEATMDLISFLKKEKGADNETIKDFIKTHFDDIRGMSLDQISDEFDEFISVNYEAPSDYMQETEEEYLEKRDAAIKKAMGKEGEVEEEMAVFSSKEEEDKYIEKMTAKTLEKEKAARKKKEVGEAMDDATMDAIKNYKPGSLSDEPHSYKPGDMFSTDFDYEGMLKAGLKIRINTPIETMQAIYDSFEDVNYHRENSHLGDVIDAVEGGNKEAALDALKKFRREIKETLSGIFEGTFPIRERDEDYVPKRRGALEERVGGIQEFVSLIEDRAANNDTMPQDEAIEVIEALLEEFDIPADLVTNIQEKKGKDHDGDGDIDGDDYMAAKDKAIKKAMKENVKAIITKVLEEGTLNEAATNQLAKFAEDYAGFEGMKGAILDLQNIVTDIEAYYDKTRDKIQKVYNTLGEIRNEEGLKVGGFLAPAIESAFTKDLRPVTRQGFTKGLDQPKVRVISQKDIDAHNSGERPLGETDEQPKQTVYTPNI